MESIITLFNQTSFQVACVICLGWFIWYKDKQQQANHKENVQAIREDNEKDKQRLYEEVKYNREVVKEISETNRLYAVDIKNELKEIKDIIK